MGRLIKKAFQVRKVLKLSSLAMLCIFSSTSLSLLMLKHNGYQLIFYNEDLAVTYLSIALFLLTFFSVVSFGIRARIKTIPSSLLPIGAIIFSATLYCCTDICYKNFKLIAILSISCSLIVLILCGKKGIIRRFSILTVIVFMTAIYSKQKFFTGMQIHDFKQSIPVKIAKSPLKPLSALVFKTNGNTAYVVKVKKTNSNIDIGFAMLNYVDSVEVFRCEVDSLPEIKWIADDSLSIDGISYSIINK